MKGSVLIVEDQFIESNDLKIKLLKAGYDVLGVASSYKEALRLVDLKRPDMVLVDIFLKGEHTGIDLGARLHEMGVAFIYISANATHDILSAAKETKPYGFVVKPYREKDVLVTMEIAHYHHNNNHEASLKRTLFIQQQCNAALLLQEHAESKLLHIARALQQHLPFDLISFGPDGEQPGFQTIGFLRIGYSEYQTLTKDQMLRGNTDPKTPGKVYNKVAREGKIVFYNGGDLTDLAGESALVQGVVRSHDMASCLIVPLILSGANETFYLSMYSKRHDAYTGAHIKFIEEFLDVLAGTVDTIVKTQPSGKVPAEPLDQQYLSHDNVGFGTIVGSSPSLLNVLDNVMQVAPFDTSVLLLGESGTGKESIASSIHNLSPRSNHPFIRINCAALPPSLIESELFGYEKGAFTGAADRRTGKFEQADKGTIFLDEIGELPIEFQPKLLRVLQERELDRIGGKAPLKIDVRIIAATNKNLEKEVAEGRFRLDLYYRLNIFPITLPPLRERREDITELMYSFLHKFNEKFGKKVTGISSKAIGQAMEYHWPGNIRELENRMERAVLLAAGSELPELLPGEPAGASSGFKSIIDNEREHIIKALRECGGKVWGKGGAAELLNLPPSTLSSKMQKLRIRKDLL